MLPGRRRDFESLFAAVAARRAGASWQAVDEIARSAIGELGRFFHASTVLFALAADEHAALSVEISWKAEQRGGARPTGGMRLDTAGWADAERPGGVLFIEDVTTTAALFPEALTAPVRSQLVFPMAVGDCLAGVLILQWTESGDPY